jgi:hypothetical protein
MHGPKGMEERDKDNLIGNEHPEEEQGKKNLRAGEFPFGKDIPV